MVGIVGQSVLLGADAIVPMLNNVYPLQIVEMRNGNFDYLHITKSLLNDFPVSIPLQWTANTIMNCTFDNLQAGNLEYLSDSISKILVKRKRTDEPYNETTWTTLFEIPVYDQSNLSFVINDFTNAYGATYVYQLVPVIVQEQGGVQIEVEGLGQDSEEIESKFGGVFICDNDSFVRLYAGVTYGDMQTTQITGVHQTLGGKYPIIVANSNVKYHTGSVSGTILNQDYGQPNEDSSAIVGLDRVKIVKARQEVDEFLTNKKPKILKDDNGNMWLVIFVDDVNYTWFNEWGRGLGDISANWIEIGDATSGTDLRRTHILGGVNNAYTSSV